MEAAQRLLAAQKLIAKGDVSEWWDNLPAEQKREYIEEHPNSKYADQAIKEGQEKKESQGPAGDQPSGASAPGSAQRKKMADAVRKSAPKIADRLKKTFPKITHAASALKHLATGKPLDHEHKEVLHELGHLAVKTALGHVVDPHSAKALGQIAVTAVAHGIEKYKEHKAKNPKGDDVTQFVEAVADGIENAETAPVPAEHAAPKSHYRAAIAKHIKASAGHIVQVIDKSFKDIKPATQGLAAFAQRKPMTEQQTKALKHLGKFALGTAIATLPGGIAAHLAAGAGAAALTHAYKAMRAGEHHGSLVHRFVESIGEGLEDALIESGEGGEGHHGGHE